MLRHMEGQMPNGDRTARPVRSWSVGEEIPLELRYGSRT
jgi:hypothetical protein